MLPMKLDLTDELAAALRQLRLNNPVNGEILTAEKLSKAIGNNRAWMSQIESRRLKKIKREDVIAIYKLLYNYDDDKAEYLAEHDLDKYYITNNHFPPFTNDYYEKMLKIDNFDKPTEDKEWYKLFKILVENLIDTFNDIILDIQTEDDKQYFANFLQKLMTNMHFNSKDTMSINSHLRTELLLYANSDEYNDIMSSYKSLSEKIETFKPRQLLKEINQKLEDVNSFPTNYKTIDALVFGLVELSQLISYDIEKSEKIKIINLFITATHKYCKQMLPALPFTIQKLNESCNKNDMLNTINELQLLLTNSNSKYNIRGKVSSYFETYSDMLVMQEDELQEKEPSIKMLSKKD